MDSVTWRKNGVEVGPEFTQTQTLTDTMSATYQHTLSSDSVAEFVDSFTCEVRDAAGNTDSRTLNINSEGVLIVIESAGSVPIPCLALGVTITVSAGIVVGSTSIVTCSSDVGNADRIEWRSREGQVLVSRDSVQQVDLVFNPVNDSLHDSDITCFVTRDEGRANQTVSNQTLSISVRGGRVQYEVYMHDGLYIMFPAVPFDPISASVNSSGSNEAGSEFTLTCTISEDISGLVAMPTAIWLNPDGGPVMPGNDITIATPPPSDRVAITTLTFNPLKTSHDEEYTCSGTITSPAQEGTIVSERGDVSVQSK